jgi:predicted dehydrogenase
MNNQNNVYDLNRRDFIGSFSSLMALMGGVAITRAQTPAGAPAPERYSGPPVNCGIIGCGEHGRELLANLSRIQKANVTALCDTYAPYLNRASRTAPKAAKVTEYRKMLENKEIEAVVVATPTHLHKEIVVEAIQAGKHVYCEAPLAHTVEDARAIAKAAKNAKAVYFQAGLQQRSDPEIIYILQFVRSGATGTAFLARSQFHKKTSWRRASPNPQFEKALNWRLRKASSVGLVGELGIHNMDSARWFLNARPNAVTGFGSTVLWNDDREIPDTTHNVLEFPRGARMTYDATLANSFDAGYDMIYGTSATVMLRDRRGWMFKEVDSPLLGWEVYARKETFFREVGIVLAANATKLAAQGDNPVIDTQIATQGSTYYAMEAFVANTDMVRTGIKDFSANFGLEDKDALAEYLQELTKNYLPAAGWVEGYEATVIAVKAHEAVMKGTRIELPDELFNVG